MRGAFTTGANVNRKGRVALAEGGTLFLDEIGELSLSLQVKLLRLLQQRTYEPVGSAESISANFRLVAATNKNLAEEVEAGRFRRDLYYRLMVCPVTLPPLRARPADTRALFNHFWKTRGERRVVHEDVMRLLESHAWPGNVRELENLVERLSVCVDAPAITLATLPPDVRALLGGGSVGNQSELTFAFTAAGPVDSPIAMGNVEMMEEGEMLSSRVAEAPPMEMNEAPMSMAPEAALVVAAPVPSADTAQTAQILSLPMLAVPARFEMPIDLPAMLKNLEDAYIDAALAQAGGNRKSAADLLGLQRTTLVEKLRRRQRDVAPAVGAGATPASVAA